MCLVQVYVPVSGCTVDNKYDQLLLHKYNVQNNTLKYDWLVQKINFLVFQFNNSAMAKNQGQHLCKIEMRLDLSSL